MEEGKRWLRSTREIGWRKDREEIEEKEEKGRRLGREGRS